jgi:hypothetical protein
MIENYKNDAGSLPSISEFQIMMLEVDMCAMDAYLEHVWSGILSKDEHTILNTYQSLDDKDQQVVLAHLKKMIIEKGWQSVQVQSAQVALRVINAHYPA